MNNLNSNYLISKLPVRCICVRILILLNLFFIVNIRYCYAQNCLEEVLKNKLYSSSNDIINGKKWRYEKKYVGSPLLMDNYWPVADIVYNGFHYTGLLVNYDVVKEETIIYHPEKGKEKYVILSKDNLSGFSFTDTLTNRKHNYEYIELPGIRGKTLYENASVGNVLFFIKPVKIIELRSARGDQGEYIGYYEYYLKAGNGFISFHSKKQLVRLLSNHSAELKRYIRKNNIKINNQHPENVIDILSYFQGLN